jgi:hypothetical protein
MSISDKQQLINNAKQVCVRLKEHGLQPILVEEWTDELQEVLSDVKNTVSIAIVYGDVSVEQLLTKMTAHIQRKAKYYAEYTSLIVRIGPQASIWFGDAHVMDVDTMVRHIVRFSQDVVWPGIIGSKLECPVCLEEWDQPDTFSCRTCYKPVCADCFMRTTLYNNGNKSPVFNCPSCRTPCSGYSCYQTHTLTPSGKVYSSAEAAIRASLCRERTYTHSLIIVQGDSMIDVIDVKISMKKTLQFNGKNRQAILEILAKPGTLFGVGMLPTWRPVVDNISGCGYVVMESGQGVVELNHGWQTIVGCFWTFRRS